MSSDNDDVTVASGRRAAIPVGRSILVVLGAVFGAVVLYDLVGPLLSWLTGIVNNPVDKADNSLSVAKVAGGLLGFIAGAGLGNLVTWLLSYLRERWDNQTAGGKVTSILGIILGLVASVPFLFFLNTLLAGQYATLAASMGALIIGFTTLSFFVLKSIEDILPWNRGQARAKRRGLKILDTNVIIDGRIVDVARTGFLEGPLYVPGFVLDELQYIADSSDPLRRQRGRRGLDVLRLMQADFQLEVRIHDKLAPELNDGVDGRLVRLARALGADIVTNDFNLNRVAVLQDVMVLNLNDLALSLRPNVLPSETLEIAIIREGNQMGQGVGYLDDGTMVVIENGRAHIGETLSVTVSQVIQTERGKMIFATVGGDETIYPDHRRRPGNTGRRP